jgi:hypothetical protein
MDPAQGGEVAKQHAEHNRAHRLVNKAWESQNPNAPAGIDFDRDILTGLQNCSLSQIRKATGLSLRHCSRIKRGYAPHKRHWATLRDLIRRLNLELR